MDAEDVEKLIFEDRKTLANLNDIDLLNIIEYLHEYVDEQKLEINILKQEFLDFKQNVKENYKQIPVNEQYEIYDDDFI